MPYDLTSAVQDKDFLSAPVADKIAFLSAHDPDFAKAAPKEQGAYLTHIMGFDNMTEFEKQNAMPQNEREANEFLLGAASGASGLPETETPVTSMVKGLGQKPSTGDIVGQSLLGPGYGIGKGLYQAGKEILAPGGTGEDAALERAHGVGTAVGMVVPAVVGEGVSKVPSRGAVGDFLHTPEGTLKPGAELAAKTAGGVAGTATGGALGHPYAGGVIGYKAGPFLLDKAFPESPATVAARNEFLNAKTITEAHEGAIKENALRDARAARAAAQEARSKAQAAKIPDYMAPGHTEVPLGSTEYPGPNLPIPQRMSRTAAAKLSELANPPAPAFYEGEGQPPKGKILGPEAKAPHVEGSYWSFKESALRQAVLGGDRDAAIVYKQRFGNLPAGAGYLTDIGSSLLRGLYKSEK